MTLINREGEESEREALELPAGYFATIEGKQVEIFHRGHHGTEGELIFSSDSIHHRRPSFWTSGDLDEKEETVLQKILWDGWGWKYYP